MIWFWRLIFHASNTSVRLAHSLTFCFSFLKCLHLALMTRLHGFLAFIVTCLLVFVS